MSLVSLAKRESRSESRDCTSRTREFPWAAADAASEAADCATATREKMSLISEPNELAAEWAVYFAAHTAEAMSEMSEAVTAPVGPAVMALRRSLKSEVFNCTSFVASAVAQTALAISGMSDA